MFKARAVRKVGIPYRKKPEKTPRISQRKIVQTLDAQAENVRNYHVVLQRNMIPTHIQAAEKRATSDPYDEMAPQKI